MIPTKIIDIYWWYNNTAKNDHRFLTVRAPGSHYSGKGRCHGILMVSGNHGIHGNWDFFFKCFPSHGKLTIEPIKNSLKYLNFSSFN